MRSSATAEDLPDASFAGQQETFLNVVGIEQVLHKMKEVFASLYNDRAISYRVHKGFAHSDVALSAGVQRMVRSDLAAAGVMFTIDTESGFKDVVFITAGYGLGETVVQGAVNPDEFYVHKPTLRSGKFPIIRRSLGSKLIRMEFATEQERAASGQLVRTVDTAARAAQPLFAERCRRDRAGALCADHRAALRPADGHRMGQGRPGRPAVHPAGPARDGEEPGRRQGSSSATGSRATARRTWCWPKAAPSARRSAPGRCA